MHILERDSFLLGLFLMTLMLILFQKLVGAVAILVFIGWSFNTVVTILLNMYMLYLIPKLMLTWAPLVDGENK